MSRITPVVLCGGGGTRLWPRSRRAMPKPFLPLLGEETLFQAALARCADGDIFAPPILIAGAAHLDLVESQSASFPEARVIVEPEGKNTAAAIALAAHRMDPDAVMLVCPSDHHIADGAAFCTAARAAGALAGQGWLTAFGITASAPETGYGYIRRGEAIEGGYRIAQFVEKPDRSQAEVFLAEGGYSWNGGLFAFRAGTFLEELAHHRPAMADTIAEAVARGHEDGHNFFPDAAHFARIEAESVDYAVMENTDRAAMVPARMGWSDIGNWQALQDARQAEKGDQSGNVVLGDAELVDCHNVMVDSDGPRVSVIGLNDVIIVVDDGEVLVTSAEGAQKVGKLGGAVSQ